MFYVFLLIDDMSGPVNIRIYHNRPDCISDLNVIRDTRLNLLETLISFKTFSFESAAELVSFISFHVLNDGVSVIDFTGVFYDKGALNFYNDIVSGLEEMEVKFNAN